MTSERRLFHILYMHKVSLQYEAFGVKRGVTSGKKPSHSQYIYKVSLLYEFFSVLLGGTLARSFPIFTALTGFLSSMHSLMDDKLFSEGRSSHI